MFRKNNSMKILIICLLFVPSLILAMEQDSDSLVVELVQRKGVSHSRDDLGFLVVESIKKDGKFVPAGKNEFDDKEDQSNPLSCLQEDLDAILEAPPKETVVAMSDESRIQFKRSLNDIVSFFDSTSRCIWFKTNAADKKLLLNRLKAHTESLRKIIKMLESNTSDDTTKAWQALFFLNSNSFTYCDFLSGLLGSRYLAIRSPSINIDVQFITIGTELKNCSFKQQKLKSDLWK
jgi:hypothetical protein